MANNLIKAADIVLVYHNLIMNVTVTHAERNIVYLVYLFIKNMYDIQCFNYMVLLIYQNYNTSLLFVLLLSKYVCL